MPCTNRAFLIRQIRLTLERDDLTTRERVKLLLVYSKLVPVPSEPPVSRKRAKKPAAQKVGPFEQPRPEFLRQ